MQLHNNDNIHNKASVTCGYSRIVVAENRLSLEVRLGLEEDWYRVNGADLDLRKLSYFAQDVIQLDIHLSHDVTRNLLYIVLDYTKLTLEPIHVVICKETIFIDTTLFGRTVIVELRASLP